VMRAAPATAPVIALAVSLSLAIPATAVVPPKPPDIETTRRAEGLLDRWQFAEGTQLIATMAKESPDAPEVLYLQGYERFLSGDYAAATVKLRAAIKRAPIPHFKELLTLAEAAGEAIKNHAERRSAHFLIRFPPEDAVMAEHALDGLEAALAALGSDLGFVPSRPIHVDIYRSPSDLAAVSTLSVEEVERTGTIALCKWGRLMATSPRALRFGYPWLDSLSHELVHYAVSSLTEDHAPVWLQEGLAKFLERRWREAPNPTLAPSSQHLLAKALASGKLITFEAMHPSMAKLPKAEDAGLAFAEVALAVANLHARGGMEALRTAIGKVRQGIDARTAVAQAANLSWPQFEHSWRAFMKDQHYRPIPGMEPVTRKFRKNAALASKRGPSEDDAVSGADPAARFLRLGNMLLLRNRPRGAAAEYEKGAKIVGEGQWLFAVKLGRTYLQLGEPERSLKVVAEVQALYPELPWPNLIAGQALLAKGEPQKAVEPLRLSLATNPFDPAVHCALAEAYQKMPPGPQAPPPLRERADRNCREMR
jgi:tetratricopeptide (TPR) repeat protein